MSRANEKTTRPPGRGPPRSTARRDGTALPRPRISRRRTFASFESHAVGERDDAVFGDDPARPAQACRFLALEDRQVSVRNLKDESRHASRVVGSRRDPPSGRRGCACPSTISSRILGYQLAPVVAARLEESLDRVVVAVPVVERLASASPRGGRLCRSTRYLRPPLISSPSVLARAVERRDTGRGQREAGARRPQGAVLYAWYQKPPW